MTAACIVHMRISINEHRTNSIADIITIERVNVVVYCKGITTQVVNICRCVGGLGGYRTYIHMMGSFQYDAKQTV